LIRAELDPTLRTVRWSDANGVFAKWNSIKNDWEMKPDYFDQVDRTIKAAGENPNDVPLAILPKGVHELQILGNFKNQEAAKDLQFVSDFTPDAKVIAKRPWDLRYYGDDYVRKSVECVSKTRKYYFQNGMPDRWAANGS